MISTDDCRKKRACVRIATTPNELSQALSLVYQSYVAAGLANHNPVQLRVLPHHALSTTDVVVAKIGCDVYGTLSLIRDSKLGLPMESVYESEVAFRRGQNLSLAEVSCLADRRGATSRELIHDLMAFVIQRAGRLGVDQMLIAVHPRHVKFYCKFLGFEVFAGLRSYETVRGNPAIALCLDFSDFSTRAPRAYQRVFGRMHARKHLAAGPMPNDAKRYIEHMLAAIESVDANSYPATLVS